jgi:AcrR family transcriptional regulator
MSARNKSSKEEKQRAISMATLEVIDKEGITGITYSKVARKSGVSRAWIYEYVGKDKKALIEFAADVLASHFSRARLEIPKTKEELENQLKDAVDFLFESTIENPVLIKIYFRFRGTDNPLGEIIKKYEKHWLDSATKSGVNIFELPQDQAQLLAEILLTLRLGFAHRVATSAKPSEARKKAEGVFNLLHSYIKNI